MVRLKDEHSFSFPLLITILALLSFGRTMALHDVAWDDNCWLLSIYFTNNLHDFLDTGFYEMRRMPMGILYYYYYSLHTLTDHAHLIWNSFNMVVQVISPLLLYAFIKNTLKGQRLLAFLIAAGFIICPIDMTLPYYANINYRLGTLFCILSFYLTERALAGKTSWPLLLAAMASSAFPLYFLLETTLTLEPARLMLIGYILSEKHPDRRTVIKKSMGFWLPFLLLCVPLIIYRLISKPYGIYSSTYSMNPYFFMNIKMHIKVLRHFLFYNWFIFLRLIGNTTALSIMLGLLTMIIGILFNKMLSESVTNFCHSGLDKPAPAGCKPGESRREKVDSRFRGNDALGDISYTTDNNWTGNWKSVRPVFIFGLMLIIPPVMMYEFSGRIPAPGMEGRHGTILLFGYSIAFGSLLYCLYRTLLTERKKQANALIILFLSLGVFFNNVNLDLYTMGGRYQKDFWIAFTSRFPSLPDKAAFLIDANTGSPFYNADLEAYYELEFPLNMLYARSTSHDEFLNYRVYAISEGIRDEWKQSPSITFQRYSHAGNDTFSSDNMIFVHYRDGKLLVNREILDTYPDVPYHMWLEKDPPEFSGKIPEYPLRYRLKGFY